MKFRIPKITNLFLIFSLSIFSSNIFAELNNLTSVSSESYDSQVKLTLDFKNNPNYKIFELTDPRRLVIDISDCSLMTVINNSAIQNSIVKKIRLGNHDNTLRLVFDLRSPIVYSDQIDPAGDKLILNITANETERRKPYIAKATDTDADDYVSDVSYHKEVGISFSPYYSNKVKKRSVYIRSSALNSDLSEEETESHVNYVSDKLQNKIIITNEKPISFKDCSTNYNDYLLHGKPNDPNYKLSTSKAVEESGINLGWSLPISLGAEYSDVFGTELTGQLKYQVGFSDGFGFKFNVGSNEGRLNATYAHVLSDYQRIKISADYLGENLNFEYLTSSEDKWVSEGAIGGTYQYLFPGHIIHDVNLNLLYSEAQSKDLGQVSIFDPDRRIAGGIDKSASVGMGFLPFDSTLIGVQLNYDDLDYDKDFPISDINPDENISGLGGTVTLDQLLGKTLKLRLLESNRKIYEDYKGELDWLALNSKNNRLEIGFTAEHISNHDNVQSFGTNNSSDNRFGLSFTYKLGNGETCDADNMYTLKTTDAHSDIVNFVNDPAAYMAKVLAAKDEGF